MRKGILGSIAVLAAGAGLAFGQPTPPFGPPGPGPVAGPGVGAPGPGPGFGPAMPGRPAYTYPDGHPAIAPPGLEGMIPPGSMGAGAPGGVYGEGPTPADGGGYGSGSGLLPGLFGGGGAPTVWARGEYLYWLPKSMANNFPFVTTSAALDFGVPARQTTAPLGGAGGDISYDSKSGVRLTLGAGFGDGLGGEISAFSMERFQRNYNFGSNSLGLPIIAVPFYDITVGSAATYVVAFPGINNGNVQYGAQTSVLGGEANIVYDATGYSEDGPGGLKFLAGARYFSLEERFVFNTLSTTAGAFVPFAPLPGVFFPATTIPGGAAFGGSVFPAAGAPYRVTTTDRIKTYNDFYGANVGFRGDIGYGGFFVNMTGKFAAGYMRQSVELEGASTLTSGGFESGQPGGLFNRPQDLGRHRRDRFAYIPEGAVSVGYQLGSFLRLSAGYNFIYVSNVVRPTTGLSRNLAPAYIPVSPAFNGSAPTNYYQRDIVQDTDFYLHGLTLGLELSF